MNNKEVLKELTETKDFLTKSQEFTKDARLRLHIEALDVAISAIEKQIPKKWIDTKSYLTCPVCESFYDMPVAEKYCPNCGQRLKED